METKNKKLKGEVKWFSLEKGYGFLTSRDGRDYFLPKSSLIDKDINLSTVGKGDLVMFDGVSAKKGPRAKNVIIMQSVSHEPKVTDDKIICPSCKRKIIPRIVFDYGKPKYSVCPFCGGTVKTFNNNIRFIITIVITIIFVFVLWCITH